MGREKLNTPSHSDNAWGTKGGSVARAISSARKGRKRKRSHTLSQGEKGGGNNENSSYRVRARKREKERTGSKKKKTSIYPAPEKRGEKAPATIVLAIKGRSLYKITHRHLDWERKKGKAGLSADRQKKHHHKRWARRKGASEKKGRFLSAEEKKKARRAPSHRPEKRTRKVLSFYIANLEKGNLLKVLAVSGGKGEGKDDAAPYRSKTTKKRRMSPCPPGGDARVGKKKEGNERD